jgi:carbamoyltransferase
VFDSPYWGPEYSNQDIERALQRAKISTYARQEDVCQTTAKLLADDKLIGWLQGRMEVGPRALGNRSILANPANPAMRDIVNSRIKGREPWRPFAPSLRLEDAADVYEGGRASPFMILAFPTLPSLAPNIPSAVHVDRTCRPQTVDRRINPRYWELIDRFKALTGVPCILNTSFNLAGEPIVCSPEDALSTFFRCGLDYLVLGDYLVWK